MPNSNKQTRFLNKTWEKLYSYKNLLFILVCCIIIVTFFMGYLDYGLHFDKVNRLNNIISIINPNAYPINQTIFNLPFFGKEIPLMYKAYISSITDLRYLPLYFFDDYYIGLKLLDLAFFILTIFFSYKIIRKYTNYTYIFALLLIVNPLLYPQILFGFVYNMHILFFIYASDLLYRYYSYDQSNRWLLFGGTFLLFFSCNFFFYNTWILAAIFVISLLFFRKQLKKSTHSFKDLFVIASAFFIGLFNYITYNLYNGFPSISPFFLRLFSRQEYNENPIDAKLAKPFIEDIVYKLTKVIPRLYGEYSNLIFISFSIVLLAYIFISVILLKRKIADKYKYYFIPIVGLVIVIALILLSPKTFRADHYIRLSPLLELSIISIVILYSKVFASIWTKRISTAFLFLFLSLNIFMSYNSIQKASINKGTVNFSPAIFDLNDYLNANNIDYNNIIFTEWGFHAQLYFFNKGEVIINNIQYKLRNKKDPELSELVRSNLIAILEERKEVSKLYFPVSTVKLKYVSDALLKVVNKMGGKVYKQKVFYERSGQEVMYLYRVEGLD